MGALPLQLGRLGLNETGLRQLIDRFLSVSG